MSVKSLILIYVIHVRLYVFALLLLEDVFQSMQVIYTPKFDFEKCNK